MRNVLGVVNFEESNVVVEKMCQYRSISALSFLGRYRVIDFVLSNMVNSGLNQIALLVKDKPRSLMEHISSASQYNINTKHGSLQMLYSDNSDINSIYFNDAALCRQYAHSILSSPCDYVLLAPSNCICRADYNDLYQAHINSDADISVLYQNVDTADQHFLGCRTLAIEDNYVTGFYKNIGSHKHRNIFMETYLMKKDFFLKLLNDAEKKSPLLSISDYIAKQVADFKIQAVKYKGFLGIINSFKEYYDISMNLIEFKNAALLFSRDWPVYTKTNDSAPAFYTRSAVVNNSLIANGCQVHGTLDNAILGRGVLISKGAVIKNSIIMPYAKIGPDCVIENTIVDKHATVFNVKEIKGTVNEPAYIKRRDNV